MSPSKSTPKKREPDPSFEEALEGLEAIVESMENEQLPLEDLVAYYEKGSRLMQRCESILDSARDRIELITLSHKGESELEPSPSAGDSASDPTLSAEADESDDDIRLF